jgi:uncharacterized protein (TIGR02145 family)
MKIKTTWRVLAFSAVLGLGVIGCGGDDNPSGGDNYNGGSNNNGGGGSDYVTLGGLMWMTKNLNVETADSWCYGDSPANCAKYGRLYTWESAKAACQLIGKRLPTRDEWTALVTAAGGESTAGSKLKSTSGWNNNGNGTDNYGFSALPGGRQFPHQGGFNWAGTYGYWWTATEGSDGGAYQRNMDFSSDYVGDAETGKNYGHSVRCVQE